MNTLYHYVHCPYCVRVRMALGLLDIEYKSVVVPYDDEKTPVDLCQKKMLPIMQFENEAMNESLDIIKKLDVENRLSFEILSEEKLKEIDGILSSLGSDIHSLCMPYWIWTPEFDENSRSYFQTKKEVKRGPFANLIANKSTFLESLDKKLSDLEPRLGEFFDGNDFSIVDIMLASHLWGMYVFPEYQFPSKWHDYLMRVKNLTQFDYHQDFWSTN